MQNALEMPKYRASPRHFLIASRLYFGNRQAQILRPANQITIAALNA
jgi:hypothetical protein